jgi:transposase
MKTPTPKKGAEKRFVKCGRSKGSVCVTTPEKGKISRHFQSLGGESVRGAAAATARKFNLGSTSGARMVKKYDREVRDGVASRANRRSTGRPKKFNADIEAEIIDAWADDDTRTYREVAKDLGLPLSTLHRWVVQRGLRRRGA